MGRCGSLWVVPGFSNYDGLGPRESDNNGETPAGVHILCKRLEVRFALQGVE